MDLNRAINELRAERDRLEAVIAQLESLNGPSPTAVLASGSRRGRKSMGVAERREVSERMKKYWAERREAKGAA